MIWKEFRAIPALLDGVNPKTLGICKIRANKLSTSNDKKNSWFKLVTKVICLLNDLSVEYVLIKHLDIPYAYMQDIDLLIENEKDRQILFSVLKERGYKPYRSLFFPHPEKVEFVKFKPRTEVDIYPEPAWWRISYAPSGLISSRRVLKKVSNVKAYLPSPTHDLYIIITHSYAHGVITLAELSHITKVLLHNQIQWDHLLSLARRYLLEHAVYIYLLLVDMVLTPLGKRIPEIQKTLGELEHSVLSRRLSNSILWANNKNTQFPIIVPISLRFLSALREILVSSALRNKPTIRELSTYWFLIFGQSKKIEQIESFTIEKVVNRIENLYRDFILSRIAKAKENSDI